MNNDDLNNLLKLATKKQKNTIEPQVTKLIDRQMENMDTAMTSAFSNMESTMDDAFSKMDNAFGQAFDTMDAAFDQVFSKNDPFEQNTSMQLSNGTTIDIVDGRLFIDGIERYESDDIIINNVNITDKLKGKKSKKRKYESTIFSSGAIGKLGSSLGNALGNGIPPPTFPNRTGFGGLGSSLGNALGNGIPPPTFPNRTGFGGLGSFSSSMQHHLQVGQILKGSDPSTMPLSGTFTTSSNDAKDLTQDERKRLVVDHIESLKYIAASKYDTILDNNKRTIGINSAGTVAGIIACGMVNPLFGLASAMAAYGGYHGVKTFKSNKELYDAELKRIDAIETANFGDIHETVKLVMSNVINYSNIIIDANRRSEVEDIIKNIKDEIDNV
jgi:hypothetical protein